MDPSSLGRHAAVWPGASYFTALDPCKMNEKGRCLLGNTRHILWDGMMNTYTKAKNRVWQIVYATNAVLLIGVLTALLEVKAVFLFLSLDEETGAQRSPITCGRLHVLSGSRGRHLGHSLLPELQEMTRRPVLCPQSPSGLLKASGLAGPPAFFPPPRWTNVARRSFPPPPKGPGVPDALMQGLGWVPAPPQSRKARASLKCARPLDPGPAPRVCAAWVGPTSR